MAHDPFLEKGLPSNIEAERSILGAVQLNNDLCREAVCLLDPSDFFLDSHRRIFDKMVALSDREMPIDLITLSSELKNANEFERVGGATYISSLIDGVPRTDTIEPYATLVREKSIRRKLIKAARDLAYRALDEENGIDVIASSFRATFDGIRNGSDIATLRPIFHSRDRKTEIEPAAAVVTGIAFRRWVTILEGLAGSGKSHVALDIAATAAQQMRVLLCTNEAPEETDARLDAFQAHHGIETPGLFILAEAIGLFEDIQIARFLQTAEGLGGFDLVVIDVLSNEFAGREETNENMAQAFSSCYRIARGLNCAVVIATHTGWSGEHTRGGSQSHGSARCVFRVEQTDEVITVKVVKANVRRDFADRKFRILQIGLDRIEEPDPKRAEEYTVLIEASRVADEVGPLSSRQSELLQALAQPIFASGGKFADLETHTKLAKSTLSNVTNSLMKRGLVAKGKSGILLLTENGRDVAAAIVETGQKHGKKATEPAPNQPCLNWQIENQGGSKISPVVPDGSASVQYEFGEAGSLVRSAPPPIGSRTTELAEQNHSETARVRQWRE